ncbi:MAG: thiamine diphosphokinase [Chloroflexi bacterium]|nr:thiamine diphosphokinase [Chloroflexota bacterium]
MRTNKNGNRLQPTDGEQINCVWVLAASPIWSGSIAVDWLPAADRIVAADGGTGLAAQLGLRPDLVVGDLDSSDPALVSKFEAAGVEVRRYKHNTKSETDTELAVVAALEYHPRKVIVLGGTGGRLDHTLANILLLSNPLLARVDIRVVEGRQEVFLAKSGEWNVLGAEQGDTVTLLPLGGDARGVRTGELEYPLFDETLSAGSSRGVSNVAVSTGARVWLESGNLLIVVLHTRQDSGDTTIEQQPT